jgi:hypothetical protein
MRGWMGGCLAWVACGAPEVAEPGWQDNFGVVETLGDAACDNLVEGAYCSVPFPSDAWYDADAGRLALSSAALPKTSSGLEIRTDLFTQDGFGVASPVLFELPGAVFDAGDLLFDGDASLDAASRTLLVDAATGVRIPHWVETDWLEGGSSPSLFVIRPSVPLPPSAHIVVAVRGFVDGAGTTVAAPEAFAALRDQTESRWLGVHARRARYESRVFPAIEAAGWSRDEVQLAWDFTTRSDAGATRDLTAVQAALYAAIGEEGPVYTIDNVEVVVGDPNLAVIVDGTAEVPSVLGPAVGGVRTLRRDASGEIVVDGVERVPFRVQIPPSVLAADAPSPVLQYGHGFLGSRDEANNGWLREMAQRHQFVILAADMQGMSSPNALQWGFLLTQDAGRMVELAEEPMQGLANHWALQRLMKGRFQDETHPALQREGGGFVVDPGQIWYHGNSQGGTMGNLVVVGSQDVPRGALGVPGCCFPFLLHRSSVFDTWATALGGVYEEADAIPMILALLGTGWDRLEGLTWAGAWSTPLPNTPAHQALLHVGLEDAQVQNEASWVLARALGAVQPQAQIRPVQGVASEAYPIDATAVVVNWDFGVAPDATPLDPPVPATDTHSGPRRQSEAQDQVVHFLRTGEVIDTCGPSGCLFPSGG